MRRGRFGSQVNLNKALQGLILESSIPNGRTL